MPILNIQYNGHGQAPNGAQIPIPPQIILKDRGPLIQVSVSIAQTFAVQLTQQGQSLPNPITGFALIDTGASMSCIDNNVAQQLNLPVINVANMASASHSSTQANIYPVKFEILGWGITLDSNQTMGAALQVQGLIALLGRDLLQHCILIYNGNTGTISLSV